MIAAIQVREILKISRTFLSLKKLMVIDRVCKLDASCYT